MNAVSELDLLSTFLRYQPDLRLFLTYKVSCSDTAADLIQETYLRVARYPVDTPIINKRALLFRIAENLALDHLRRKSRLARCDGGLITDDLICLEPQPDCVLSGQQQMQRFEQLIIDLPVQCRTVFLLCRVEGKSYAEIAAQLNISTRTVESHMHRALKWLKTQFDIS